ncbi:Transcriptional regulator, AraC family [Hyphomicrobium sulfonivorans]|uniref:Transcriptional regulator, AraC family n=1 Tax=Hyphomicrobium sulfonivorans TaxID=121290 RepID=A0A125NWH6_HYPSL|nr:helix-turn-helix domain-containing protein [Hyphomicrobium sulfonivorans]KWT72988.1 Transcriptional regulator, AraC family [Hyphomicrobium sulfonivorans]
MQPADEKQVAYIDCYRFDFPASDPQSPDLYQKLMQPVFEFEVPNCHTAAPFFASAEIYALPDVTVSRSTTGACRFKRTIKSIAQSANDQILVVCYTSGHFTLEADGQTRRVEAGEVAFIDLSQEVVIEAPSVANISLAISRRKLEAMLPFLDDAHCFVREQGPLTAVLLGMMEEIIALGPTIPVVDARAIAGSVIGLAAACLEMLSRQQVERGSAGGIASLVSIKAAIGQRIADPELSPQALLDELGIARSTLYRLFEPMGGVSAYITERRLHYAFRLMVDPLQPRQRISQLAFKLGFSHPSVFTRSFKDRFGMSPKDVRALAAQSKASEVELLASPEVLQYLSPIARARDVGRRDTSLQPERRH